MFYPCPASQIWLPVPPCLPLGLGCQESSRGLTLPLMVSLGGAGWAAASSGSLKQESE